MGDTGEEEPPLSYTEEHPKEEELHNDATSDYTSASSMLGGEELVDDEGTTHQQRIFNFSMPFGSNFSLPNAIRVVTRKKTRGDLAYNDAATTSGTEHMLFSQPYLRVDPRMDALKKSLTPAYFSDDHHPASRIPKFEGNVVVLGGYRGSVLRDTHTGRQMWLPIKLGLRMRKVSLELGLEDVDEANAHLHTYSDRMLTHVGPIDISKRLIKLLGERSNDCKVHEFGYDWRLSTDISGQQLYDLLKELGRGPYGKGTIIVAHSMGGLVAHRALHLAMKNGDSSLIRGVIYAGTPYGCPQILSPLRFGDSIMLARDVLTARANFSMRCSFSLLPLDGRCFVNAEDPDEEYRIDFFDPEQWTQYNLSPCVSLDEQFRRTQGVDEDGLLIPHDDAIRYLSANLKRAKQTLMDLRPQFPEADYPPMATIYSSAIPTARGVLVNSRDDIATCSFDKLLYGAGDGVVYRRNVFPQAAGYEDGDWNISVHRSEYGHVGLLADVRVVGEALTSILVREGNRVTDLFPVESDSSSLLRETSMMRIVPHSLHSHSQSQYNQQRKQQNGDHALSPSGSPSGSPETHKEKVGDGERKLLSRFLHRRHSNGLKPPRADRSPRSPISSSSPSSPRSPSPSGLQPISSDTIVSDANHDSGYNWLTLGELGSGLGELGSGLGSLVTKPWRLSRSRSAHSRPLFRRGQ